MFTAATTTLCFQQDTSRLKAFSNALKQSTLFHFKDSLLPAFPLSIHRV